VRHQNIHWSYGELKARVQAFAAGLLALGIEPGDRVGIWSPNNAEWVITQFATAKLGAILVNINPAYRLAELDYALNKVGCKALITADSFKTSNYVGMLRELAPDIDRSVPGKLRTVRLPALTTLIRIGSGAARGFFAFEEVPAMGSRDCAALEDLGSKLQFDDPINIQFTSGTTGTPKGATLTHHNILNNGYFVGEAIRLTEHDRVCIPVPLYHCFGMILGNLACISHGAVMVYPSEGFDALAALETVAAERCTALYGVPTMFIAELGHPRFKDSDLTSASRCPSDLMSTRRCNTAPKLRPS
jgi:fatty-acyl-CoA synthase